MAAGDESGGLAIALGGHALSRPRDIGSIEEQFERTARTADHIVPVLEDGPVLLTHGNGPQVGNIVLRSELAVEAGRLPALPLYTCVADTQGGMGHMIQAELANGLRRAGLDRPVATVVTQVVVQPEDPAFDLPEKPIGQVYGAEEAAELREHGWSLVETDGGYRRVVASPLPRRIVEIEAIRTLHREGMVAVAAGGGGIPVVETDDGSLRPVEAVIDKDRTTALLAAELGCEVLVILTDVDRVKVGWNTADERPIERIGAGELRELHERGEFPPGSMGPKVEAAISFLASGGRRAAIGLPEEVGGIVAGEAGTQVT